MKHKVIFQPMGVRSEIEEGQFLRAAARQAGVEIKSLCGEKMLCGKCRVVIRSGDFPKDGIISRDEHLVPAGAAEQAFWAKRRKGLVAQGKDPAHYRLACQARVCGDLVVSLPEGSLVQAPAINKHLSGHPVEVRPNLRKIYVEIDPAGAGRPAADWERLKEALQIVEPLTRGPSDLPVDFQALTIDLPALQALQKTIRAGQWRLTVTICGGCQVVRVEPGYAERLIGLAIDIGTTTIAGYLCDLHNGEVLAIESLANPQLGYGEDVMSRMAFAAESEEHREILHKALLQAIAQLSRRAARQAAVKASDIQEFVVVGNTTMHHFFLGLDTLALGRAPYTPALQGAVTVKARDLGLETGNPGASVYLPPIVASFVGADALAVLVALAPYEQDENWLIIDVGTNAELLLGNREGLVCTSTPTGPAFEGAHIEHGMRAAQGAIERVEIEAETKTPRFKVIGSEKWSNETNSGTPRARGICGTGIIEAVAEMYRAGLLRPDGRFSKKVSSPNWIQGPDGPAYVLAWGDQTVSGDEITVTQKDVRQVQLAKAPLYVAAKYLLNQLGRRGPDRVWLAGSFGSDIDVAKAMRLGMFPDCPLEKVRPAGNAAGDGARILLLNREKRRAAVALLQKIQRVELPRQAGFQEELMAALYLPHQSDPYPHLQELEVQQTAARPPALNRC